MKGKTGTTKASTTHVMSWRDTWVEEYREGLARAATLTSRPLPSLSQLVTFRMSGVFREERSQ